MRIYRICQSAYAHEPFSGEGGRYGSGRWHRQGVRIVYASTEQGTAALEVLVNTRTASALDVEHSLVVARLPDELVARLPEDLLPSGWNAPLYGSGRQEIGERWLRERSSLALLVPSATLGPAPMNVPVNPIHPEIGALVVERVVPHAFDERFRALLPE